jgi:hypothetical protein
MFSLICAAGGAAPIGVHHGHVNFDFNQAVHPAFALVGAGGGGGAPPGCCLAMTMEWMHNWAANGMTAFSAWVNPPGAGGNLGVLANTVAVFGPPGPWPATTVVLMGGYGFAPAFGGLNPGPPWALRGPMIRLMATSAAYTILIYGAAGAAGHAVGIKRVGNAIFFFDCNHGEVYFPTADDFAAWFAGGYSAGVITPLVAAPVVFHSLRFN